MYPILAIDFGTKRLGIAVSDNNGVLCTPLETLRITKNRGILELIEDIKRIAEEYRIQKILVGKPQSFNADQEINHRRIDNFINTLAKRIELPIETWDESFSTSVAKDMLLSTGQHFKQSKEKIDSVAASVFLQEYLNSKKQK